MAQAAPGTDVALLNGMAKVIVDENLYDKAFIEARCENFEAFKEVAEIFRPGFVEKTTGVPKDKIVEAARMYATTKPASILYTMGITQHTHGTDNVHADRQPGDADRQYRQAVHGRQSAARPEQRAGRLRHGCPAERLHRLPERRRPNSEQKFETAWDVKLTRKTRLDSHGNAGWCLARAR